MSLPNYKVTTRIHDDGRRIVYFKSGKQDPKGRRCYCVVFNDMSLNDVYSNI